MSDSKNLKDKDVNFRSITRPKSDRRKASGGLVEIEADLCKECSLCVEACPAGVLRISENLNKMGYHPAAYIGEGCTGCGICFYVCPEPGTIKVHKKNQNIAINQ